MSDAARRSVEVPTGRQTAARRRSGAGSGLRRFERSWRDDHLAWICGFANAQGGILEIGKDDNGEIVGVRNVLSLLEDIPSKDPAPHRVSVGAHVKIGDLPGRRPQVPGRGRGRFVHAGGPNARPALHQVHAGVDLGHDRGLGARDPADHGALPGGRQSDADLDPGAGRRPLPRAFPSRRHIWQPLAVAGPPDRGTTPITTPIDPVTTSKTGPIIGPKNGPRA